jgi:hypothetical protein
MSRLRVGIIGLGRRWRRAWLPALATLGKQYEVCVVHDPSPERTAREAGLLECRPAPSASDLVADATVEAVIVADPPWYRLWPVELALAAGKPVLLGGSAALADPRLDALADATIDRNLPVLAPLWLADSPAMLRLRDLLAGQFGPVHLVIGQCARPGTGVPTTAPDSGWVQMAAACATLLGPAGASELARALSTPDGGPTVRLLAWREPGRQRAGVRLRVVAERGAATATLPSRLAWSDPAGQHVWRAPPGWSAALVLLERFRRACREGAAAEPGLDFARRVLRCLPAGGGL